MNKQNDDANKQSEINRQNYIRSEEMQKDAKCSLIFDSHFESGNLDCVVKVSDNEYDLFMRVDSNTKGHL